VASSAPRSARGRTVGLAAWLALALVAGGPAAADDVLTVADAIAAGSVASGDGSLTFTFAPDAFSASGALPADPAAYTLTVLDRGLRLGGTITVADGEAGVVTLDYGVVAAQGGLTAADLETVLTASPGASSAVVQDLFDPAGGPAVATLVAETGQLADGVVLAGAPAALDVETTASADSGGPGGAASISSVDQTYSVPEPGSASAAAAAALALGALRRRRRRRRETRPARERA